MKNNNSKVILLTGSTGFLGTHLLFDVIRYTQAKIYCLVRSNGEEIENKFKHQLEKYAINIAGLSFNRITLIKGDLQHTQLGLSNDLFSQLIEEVDIIIHNGAQVHHVYDYQTLKQTNVNSTKEILRICSSGKEKFLYYISTISAVSELDSNGLFIEEFPKENNCTVAGGYNQSKWVCERLLEQANQKGINVTIFRPPLIGGHSKNGLASYKQDHFLNFIKLCIDTKIAPDYNFPIHIIPVDFVSKFIIKSIASLELYEHVINMILPKTASWPDIINMIKDCGYQIELLPLKEWQDQIISLVNTEDAFSPLLSEYIDKEKFEDTSSVNINNKLFLASCKKLNLTYPIINVELWKTYLQFLSTQKFISAPNK